METLKAWCTRCAGACGSDRERAYRRREGGVEEGIRGTQGVQCQVACVHARAGRGPIRVIRKRVMKDIILDQYPKERIGLRMYRLPGENAVMPPHLEHKQARMVLLC